MNNLSGGDTGDLQSQIEHDLNMGNVKRIVWALGMNDAVDVDINTPDVTWKSFVNILHRLCPLLGIELILCTIPSVPSRYHGGKNKYIRELGVRYIDFDDEVDNGVDYTWKTDMLSGDNVHPSELGAISLANRAMIDLPELLS